MLAVAACASSSPPSHSAKLPASIVQECVAPPCRIGANGTQLTGLAVELAPGVHAVALSSGQTIPLP
jgi:hypothetical protein